jgi:YD repeat-containing protein
LQRSHQYETAIEQQTTVMVSNLSPLTNAVVYTFQNVGTTPLVRGKEVWNLNKPITSTYTSSYVDSRGVFQIDKSNLRNVHSFNSYDPATGNLLQQTSVDGVPLSYEWENNNFLVTKSIVNSGLGAQASVYEYSPFNQLSRVVDANGIGRSYQYDWYGRLFIERDHDYNILNRYRYHYPSEVDKGNNGDKDDWLYTVI